MCGSEIKMLGCQWSLRLGCAGPLDLPAKEREWLSAKICSYLQSENAASVPWLHGYGINTRNAVK